ncbi:hypothetical protein L6164_003349 [Bauhinia variegata]|uniref:Uncharacterized protein n=1 Tax=Bauhinia variegata TaxID=167791 RepID=A0ACB9Q1M6_BAUVA|nr:hypothetical protein L6164_003349 [Bauhinia variegata]
MYNPCDNFSLISTEACQLNESHIPVKMSKAFRDMVSARMKPMKAKMTKPLKKAKMTSETAVTAVPTSTVPNDATRVEGEGKKKSSTPKYTVLDKFRGVDFEMTEECFDYLMEIHRLSFNPNRSCTFAESMKNWYIELRQRPDMKCDFYFDHPRAGRQLRSITEVVYFLLNGAKKVISKAKEVGRPRKSISRNKRTGKGETNVVEVPQPTMEAAEVHQPAVEAADIPQPALEAAEVPQPSAEEAEIPQPAAEAADIPQPALEAADIPQPAVEAADIPQPAAEAAEIPQPAVEAAELPHPAAEAAVDLDSIMFDEIDLFPTSFPKYRGSWDEIGLGDFDLISEIPICDFEYQFPGMQEEKGKQ